LNGGVYYQHDINVTKENLTIKSSGNGGTPIINGEGQGRGFNVSSNGVLIQDLTITNTYAGNGGGVYMYGTNCSVSGCSFINSTAVVSGGVCIGGANGSVSGCSFTNNKANNRQEGSGSGVDVIVGGCSVVFNRFVNNTASGNMVSNDVKCGGSCNVSSNWWVVTHQVSLMG